MRGFIQKLHIENVGGDAKVEVSTTLPGGLVIE